MLKIGEFAQLGNISIRALRFYHEAGLLEPAHVDPSSSYRGYEPRQLRELQDIRLYKEMGFSLAEIRELLRERPSPGELRELLRERRALLKERIEEDFLRLTRIEAQLEAGGAGEKNLAWRIELRETAPVWVAACRDVIRSYDECEEMFVDLERRIAPELLAGKRAALWHTCLSDGPQIDCEALRFLKHPGGLPRGMRTYQMPVTRVASLFHTGGEQTSPRAYKALQAWLEKNNLTAHGPKCEVYWLEPSEDKPGESLTEIRLAVAGRGGRPHSRNNAA